MTTRFYKLSPTTGTRVGLGLVVIFFSAVAIGNLYYGKLVLFLIGAAFALYPAAKYVFIDYRMLNNQLEKRVFGIRCWSYSLKALDAEYGTTGDYSTHSALVLRKKSDHKVLDELIEIQFIRSDLEYVRKKINGEQA